MKSLTLLILSSLAFQSQADTLPMKIDVIPSHENLHRIFEGDPFKPQDTSDPFGPSNTKISIPEPHPHKVQSLGEGPIYNISELLRNVGLSHDDNELFLYSPKSKLMFCHARTDRIAYLEALMEPLHQGLVAHQVSLWADLAELQNDQWIPKTNSKRLIFSIRSRSGVESKVKFENGTNCMVQITLGDSNDVIDIIINGDVLLGDSILSIKSHFVGEPEQDLLVFERLIDPHENQRQRLFIRIDPKPTQDQLRFDPAWRKEHAKKIAAEMGLKTLNGE